MQPRTLKPLEGLRVVVTRPAERSQALSEKLRAMGAVTIEIPAIKIVPPTNLEPLDRAIRALKSFDWMIFTSVHGVEFFLERLRGVRLPTDVLADVRVAAIGPATATALRDAGKLPDYVPDEYLSERIVEGLGNLRGKRILLLRSDIASKRLPELIRKRGGVVEDIVAYRTVIPAELKADRLKTIFAEGVDVITFTSPSTVRNLAQVVGSNKLRGYLRTVKVACIGPLTSDAARQLGITVNSVAKSHTTDGLLEVIVDENRVV